MFLDLIGFSAMFIKWLVLIIIVDTEEETQDEAPEEAEIEILSASDLERYCYCPLSWWLGRHGIDAKGEAVKKGKRSHSRIGKEIGKIQRKETELKKFERIVLWFAVMASVLALVGVTFLTTIQSEVLRNSLDVIAVVWLLAATFFLFIGENLAHLGWRIKLEAFFVVSGMIVTIIAILSIPLVLITDQSMAYILEVLALVWLIGATVFFYFALKRHKVVEEKKEEQGIEEGEIDYVDGTKIKPQVLFSDHHNLSGRPDYILKINNRHIPVEVKTGRVPRGPLFSHIIQLSCYMLIVENNFGTPPYGILRYGEREHKIDYTEDLRATLLEKIGEMRDLIETGEAHRNHKRPGKCRSCSRREKCPERLV